MSDDNYLYIPYAGSTLLETPLLNKGAAFTHRERRAFNLMGLLPPRYETIEEQVERAYGQYCTFTDPLQKHIYLRAIQDNNETLFFRLVQNYIEEMMPIIYTPTVGDACVKFSDIYRRARGLFLSYEERHHMEEIIFNARKRKVEVIVVTDGERILGLGDQGIGGMGISIGKLSLYTACGGISPAHTLPITLDVGTNNEKLLQDPRYMGQRHPRISQAEYDEFIDMFMQTVKRRWPQALIQFEDFAQPNAMPLLRRYRDKYRCFNDDIQGTAVVTLGTILAACKKKQRRLSEMNITFVGGGSAGCGIAEMLIAHMQTEGLTEAQARDRVYIIDRQGLLVTGMDDLRDFQQALCQPQDKIDEWVFDGPYPQLKDVVRNARTDVLIGVSGVAGLFTEEVIKLMAEMHQHPIIFPLSNPSTNVEAHPEDVIKWSDGRALVATGSPFADVFYKGQRYPLVQCNNSYIFPGIGLGVIAAKARHVSDGMLMAAANALADSSPLVKGESEYLLPRLTDVTTLSKQIALAVGLQAMDEGLALQREPQALAKKIERIFWQPEYRQYKRVSY